MYQSSSRLLQQSLPAHYQCRPTHLILKQPDTHASKHQLLLLLPRLNLQRLLCLFLPENTSHYFLVLST